MSVKHKLRYIKVLMSTFLFIFSIPSIGQSLSIPSAGQSINDNQNVGASCTKSEDCLLRIAGNTYAALQYINKLPNYILAATQAFSNLTENDTTEATQNLQSSFTQFGNQMINNFNLQNSNDNLIQLAAANFGVTPDSFKPGSDASNQLKDKPFNVNDLSYTTMLGLPPMKDGQGSAFGYLTNASGINLAHSMPQLAWGKNPNTNQTDYNRYLNLYKTVMAAQTFGSYVLDNLVAENQNGNESSSVQMRLVQQVTSSDQWFQKIASQSIGTVLRQILLFNSQLYVLMTQVLQVQKQMLTAQVMTNSLMIAVNQDKESLMTSRAQGIQPR